MAVEMGLREDAHIEIFTYVYSCTATKITPESLSVIGLTATTTPTLTLSNCSNLPVMT